MVWGRIQRMAREQMSPLQLVLAKTSGASSLLCEGICRFKEVEVNVVPS